MGLCISNQDFDEDFVGDLRIDCRLVRLARDARRSDFEKREELG